MAERIIVNVADHVAEVRLNRPEKLNALDAPMFDAIVDAGVALGRRPDVRAVVLSGEGRAFSAGLDFASFMQMASGDGGRTLLHREAGTLANHAQRIAYIWQELRVPVIAAIHGYAFGGGLQLALGADIRIAGPDTELSVMEIRWGLVPDMSGTQTLRHLVRLDVAKELAFTGRRVGAEEALRLGLVTRLADDPRESALAMAREIAGRSPDAIVLGKRLLNASVHVSVAEGLVEEERHQMSLIGSKNQLEAVSANMAKRTPAFDDRPLDGE
jgi:enoyl-CoA hydratase/carnithine racemase